MSKYGHLARSDGHSKWFLQKTLVEHDRSMDHPWMQMIYNQSFSIKQYAAWLARNYAVFKALESKIDDSVEPLKQVHDASLLRAGTLETDLARLLGPSWSEEVEKMCEESPATRRYLEQLEKDAANPWLVLAHHFLQYNAVLSGGAYLGEMVSQKLCAPHGAPGVRFYAFDGVKPGKESARVQQYIRDFDKIEITTEDKDKMLVTMRGVYNDTEAMMAEVFELNPAKGIKYTSAKDGNANTSAGPLKPCAEQLEIDLAALQTYTGENGGRILMSLAGELLDVSSGRELYGPGGGYSMLAGHDVTRCLATMSLEPDDLDDMGWSPESAEDTEALNNWRARLKEKYPVAGKLLPSEEPASSSDGLRKRKDKKEDTDKAASAGGAAVAGDGQKCPISGKEGTCPMAAIMGIGGKAPETAAASTSSSADKSTGFMKGKSLVASVDKNSSSQESLLYRLCPLHWDDNTIRMVVVIAVASWASGIFIGWNLRKIIMS
eukprot:gb/GFBE01083032.1/.p1 GENE.gb/GFBE01083032.1/~~gb/GFBE01083032.1/.p1  ORF type:complete len:491 (+),score=122.77 gb/GFBE01083032.1/:1-1473(+)